MRTKFYFLFLGMFLVALLAFCKRGPEPEKVAQKKEVVETKEVVQTEQDKIIKRMFFAEGMKPEEHMEKAKSLAEKIIKMKGKIRTHFESGQAEDFEAIADLLGENATVITPQYKKVQGKKGILQLWRMAREEAMKKAEVKKGKVSLEVRIDNIFLTDALGLKEVEVNEKKVAYDCLAYVIWEFRIIIKEGGEISQNETYVLSQPILHQNICEWEI